MAALFDEYLPISYVRNADKKLQKLSTRQTAISSIVVPCGAYELNDEFGRLDVEVLFQLDVVTQLSGEQGEVADEGLLVHLRILRRFTQATLVKDL